MICTLVNWIMFCLIPDAENVWEYFHNAFTANCKKHAPLKKCRIRGMNNPWFTEELAFTTRERNA